MFSIVGIVVIAIVDAASVTTTSVVDAADVVAAKVTTANVVATNVVVAIVVATSITSIDYPIFTLQNKHKSKFSYHIFNLHSPCDEIIPLATMGTTTTSCNLSTITSLVFKLFHPKKRLS